jgi:hypothetical protein
VVADQVEIVREGAGTDPRHGRRIVEHRCPARGHAGARLIGPLAGDVEQQHAAPHLSAGGRDAAAHGSGAEYGDRSNGPVHWHASLTLSRRR